MLSAAGTLVQGTVTAPQADAENPIVRDIFTADPAALVAEDRLFVYTGRDEASPTQNNFVMNEWHAFSSANPSTEPEDWTAYGALLSVDDFAWANSNAFAGEVEQGPDGRYYWYVSINGSTDPGFMNIGVAVGDSPTGPFTDAIGGPLIRDDMPNSSALNIDPTVFRDDDGEIYMYWGSFWEPRVVKLKDNMVELDGPIIEPEGIPNFWEAPWMFKRGDTYYLAFASNFNVGGDGCVTSQSFACIRYATADNPLGPWSERGIVLDQVSSTTNHPAIIEFQGQWYMVYHTADLPDGGNFRRSVAIDPLFFNPDGTMQKVVQTPIPVEPDPVPTDNVALSATPSASTTSPWENISAINDGIDPPQSNDALNPRWGTWPESGTQWIQLDWDRPVRVDASEMYFFQDVPPDFDGGVKAPASWSIQYWDGEQFVDVENPSEYGTALDQFNETTFDPVTTTRLRATLQSQTFSGAGGVGVLEWKVKAVQPAEIRPVHIPTLVGEEPALPDTATFVYADGTSLDAPVHWPDVDPEELAKVDNRIGLAGVADGSLTTADGMVYVRASDDVSITDLRKEKLVTLPGMAPTLPPTVIATFDDGSRDSRIPVVWEDVDPALYAEPGDFKVDGEAEGTPIPARAKVTVLAGAP